MWVHLPSLVSVTETAVGVSTLVVAEGVLESVCIAVESGVEVIVGEAKVFRGKAKLQ